MALKLRVISDQYKQLGKQGSRLFGVSGGRIGRASDNDWVLPDPDRYISSHHAKVSFRAGRWILEDTSTNGVFVNDNNTPVSVEGPCPLRDGDRLRLGDYEVLVSIDDRNDFPPEATGQLPHPPAVRSAKSVDLDDLGEALDITDLLSESSIRERPKHIDRIQPEPPYELTPPQPRLVAGGDSQVGAVSLLNGPPDEGQQRTVAQARRTDDWAMQTRPFERNKATLTPLPTTAVPAEPSTKRRSDGANELQAGVEAFCRGAGIDPAALSIDAQATLLTLAGQMLREVVLGLMEAMKGRADMKGRFHINQTSIQPTDNNPLKFSASVEDAIRKLLDAHSSRYLGPVEAFRDAFGDLKTHQLATTSATQAALDELMGRLDPKELQERFDRGLKRGALLGAANKMKYWDLYAEFFGVLNQRDGQGLPPVFSEAFSKNYAEKVAGFQGGKKK